MKDFKYKNILVTGGTGFVGKNIKPYLEKLGVDVLATGSEYNLMNFSAAEELFTLKRYDLIIHGAAFQGAGDFTLKYPAEQFFKNNLIHTNALECWKRHQPQARFLGLGSSCSYPGGLEVLSESDYLTGPMHPSVETYGLTKCVLQQGIRAYKKQYGLKGSTVILGTLYGPHDEFSLKKSHVVSALIRKFCEATAAQDPTVEVWGDGAQTRDLLYVEDQIEGLLMACKYDGDLINIGSGIRTRIRDLALLIKKETGFKGEIVYNPNRFVGAKHKALNIEKAKKEFGWTVLNKMHSLQTGLAKTIKWYTKEAVNTP